MTKVNNDAVVTDQSRLQQRKDSGSKAKKHEFRFGTDRSPIGMNAD